MGSIYSFCFSCYWKVQIAIKKTVTNQYIKLRLADEGHYIKQTGSLQQLLQSILYHHQYRDTAYVNLN